MPWILFFPIFYISSFFQILTITHLSSTHRFQPFENRKKVMSLITSCCYSSLRLPVPILHVELLDTMPKTRETHPEKRGRLRLGPFRLIEGLADDLPLE